MQKRPQLLSPHQASRARAKPWFERLARAGLSARAAIYAALAYIAAEIALTQRLTGPGERFGRPD